jgi:DhnA family fructose-bisphosphate aldolase class Ia
VKEIMKAGAIGIAVGRNVWQSKEPLKVAREIRKIIFPLRA